MPRVTLYKQKKGRKTLATWWIYYRRDGKTVRKSTGTTDLEEAQETQKRIQRLLALERRQQLTEEFYRATQSLDKREIPIKDFFASARADAAFWTISPLSPPSSGYTPIPIWQRILISVPLNR